MFQKEKSLSIKTSLVGELQLYLDTDSMNKSESDTESYIWYAAYGSNLLKERFMCYLQGTEFRADNGTILRAPPKCDAGTSIQGDHPFNDQPFRLPFKLYLAREKSKWGLVE